MHIEDDRYSNGLRQSPIDEPMSLELRPGRASRSLSALLVATYIIGAFAVGGMGTALRAIVFCAIPWACVWFPEAMGSYTGGVMSGITKASPAIMVWFMGWVVLLLPLAIMFLLWIQ